MQGVFAVIQLSTVLDLLLATALGVVLLSRVNEPRTLWLLRGYLLHAEALWAGVAPSALNFGPRDAEISVRRVLELYGTAAGAPIAWQAAPAPPMEEAQRLALDSSLAMQSLGWAPRHDAASAIAATAAWYEAWRGGADGRALVLAEIEDALSP